jgi:hypothetical protein
MEGDEEEEVSKGCSMIVSPMGEVLAGPLRGQNGLLTAETDLKECVRGKFDLHVEGHYARYRRPETTLTHRGDLFKMSVNTWIKVVATVTLALLFFFYLGAPSTARSTRYIRVSAKMNNVPGGPKTRFPHPGAPRAIFPINRPEGFHIWRQ